MGTGRQSGIAPGFPDFPGLIRDHAGFVAARCVDGETIAKDMRRAADEVERLQAIVDKLPVTADGVPVVQGIDTVWERSFGQVFEQPTDGMSREVISTRYSTREAAEEARRAEG